MVYTPHFVKLGIVEHVVLLQREAPKLYLLVYNPRNAIVASVINHREIGYINQITTNIASMASNRYGIVTVQSFQLRSRYNSRALLAKRRQT